MPEAILAITRPTGGRSPALRFHINRGDDFSRVANGVPRAEISFSELFHFSPGWVYRIEWEVYIPSNFTFDMAQAESMLQIHQGQGNGPPPFAILLKGDDYMLEIRGGARAQKRAAFWLGSIWPDRGRWGKWSMTYRAEESGLHGGVSIWRAGKLFFEAEDIANSYPADRQAYLKIGIYKWAWKYSPSDIDDRELFYGPLSVTRCRE
ncbi:heparin lyase I family protein [Cupriavidus sp. IDO]|uniref:heparin lyase I family protein n=1 Tax=Cupriavidus sp. IDO TaxID=1539142 RepID=UPI00187BDB17|nr:heparin lyase I family protein [Cupriavidus sp. IDO]